jgi:small nuclear ribonucleoprotein (snRNP)-like protein
MKTICETDSNALDEFIGRPVFVRTVTHHYSGQLVAVDDKFLVLEDAAWIGSDGRFSVALATGELDEIEPYPAGRVLVAVGALCDLSVWAHELPRTMK